MVPSRGVAANIWVRGRLVGSVANLPPKYPQNRKTPATKIIIKTLKNLIWDFEKNRYKNNAGNIATRTISIFLAYVHI